MKDIALADVRNFVLVGHTGSGKTALIDALLYKMGINDRLGSTDDGTSMADWTDEEKERKITMWAKPFDGSAKTAAGKPLRLVFVDTPGYADFYGQVVAATAVADAALITVDATSGIQVGTNRSWRRIETLQLPRAVVITGLDKENANFDAVLASVQKMWGARCVPVTIPTANRQAVVDVLAAKDVPADVKDTVEELKGKLVEAAAETNDALLEKYLGGETLAPEEIANGLRGAVNNATLVPVFVVAARQGVGLPELISGIGRLFPSPLERPVKDAAGQPVGIAPDAPLAAFVWRTLNDPFVGHMNFVRVYGGTFKADGDVFNVNKQQKERIATVYMVRGKKQETIPEAHAGDIIALTKLKHTELNDTLTLLGGTTKFAPITFPNPVMAYAVSPKTQGDEDKLGSGLQRVCEEDPTLSVQRNTETHQMILAGMGDVHLDTAVGRLRKRSNVEVVLTTPKVAYRETVQAVGEGHYKHKKQSGGRGQYGEVYLRVGPRKPDDDEWFEDGLVGTAVPRSFLPAIQKGLQEGLVRGSIAGYPVINCKVTIYDGSSHEVDSSEIAFKIAASRAFADGMSKSRPVLLEPIMKLKVTIPEQFMGDITGDLNHRRGRIQGMDNEDGMQVIIAEVPQAEMFQYASQFRSITGGQGSFEMEPSRYDLVPSHIAQKVIAEAAKEKKAEEE